MLKRTITIALAVLLFQTVIVASPSYAGPKDERQARRTDEVRTGILSLGTGPDARVSVKLRNKVKLAGYISEAKADSFAVTDPKTGQTTTVPYADTTQVKGHNLSTGAKIAIGIGIGVGVTILVVYLIFLNLQD